MELAILHGIQDTIGCPFLDAVFTGVTMLGEHGIIWIVIALLLLVPPKTRRWALIMVIAVFVAWMFGEHFLKPLIARPRPFVVDPTFKLIIAPPSGYSFPSGHTLTAFCAATVLSFSPLKNRSKAIVWIVAILIAFSRLYLCVHNPTDVLGGALIGFAFGLAAVWIGSLLHRLLVGAEHKES